MRVAKILLILIAVSTATVTSANVTIDFPIGTDTWEVEAYPLWWHEGDTVYGDRDLGNDEFSYATVTLQINYNYLTDLSQIDIDLRLDGTTVFSWTVVRDDGDGLIIYEGTISYTPTGIEEIRFYETNDVLYGGSIWIGDTQGTIEFQTGVGIETASLGEIKAAFK
ncbi:MAG: hypothetical protein GY771_03650 [bacterium]|nr:hypothetical protein [bacterium]